MSKERELERQGRFWVKRKVSVIDWSRSGLVFAANCVSKYDDNVLVYFQLFMSLFAIEDVWSIAWVVASLLLNSLPVFAFHIHHPLTELLWVDNSQALERVVLCVCVESPLELPLLFSVGERATSSMIDHIWSCVRDDSRNDEEGCVQTGDTKRKWTNKVRLCMSDLILIVYMIWHGWHDCSCISVPPLVPLFSAVYPVLTWSSNNLRTLMYIFETHFLPTSFCHLHLETPAKSRRPGMMSSKTHALPNHLSTLTQVLTYDVLRFYFRLATLLVILWHCEARANR